MTELRRETLLTRDEHHAAASGRELTWNVELGTTETRDAEPGSGAVVRCFTGRGTRDATRNEEPGRRPSGLDGQHRRPQPLLPCRSFLVFPRSYATRGN